MTVSSETCHSATTSTTDLTRIDLKINPGKEDESGPGRSVGLVTGYGLDGQEIESRWG
jgi:hypothetical protein